MPFTITIRCTLIMILISSLGYGQSIDSLAKLESKQIYKLYNNHFKKNEVKAAEIYAKAYLRKAKSDKINFRIGYGYSFMAFTDITFEQKIKYLDSAISITKNLNNKHFPTMPYLYKGNAYDHKGHFIKALDSYIEGLRYVNKHDDYLHEDIFTHNIAILKRKLGKYEEAKVLLKKCLDYRAKNLNRSKNDSISYFGALGELITVYIRNREIDSARILNTQGFKMSQNLPNNCLFQLNHGILQYHKEEYKSAIITLNKALKEFSRPNNKYFSDAFYFIDTYFYLGKSFEKIRENELAIDNYKKIDSLIEKTNYLTPKIRPAYERIIKHYKTLNDKNNQLYYINRLLHNDSILDQRFNTLNNKLIKYYDTPILLKEKEKLIASLEKENTKISSQNIIILILLGLSIIGIAYYYYRQKRYKERFLKLLHETNDHNQKSEILSTTTPSDATGINKEAFDNLIDQLEQFEKNKGYLKPRLNSKDLAKSFGSNSSYLSKVINTFKEKSFSNYINDLRIDFVIDRLQTDAIFRKYTIKAIAQDIGFNNAEAFSKAFYKKTGIYPSYFIKELDKR